MKIKSIVLLLVALFLFKNINAQLSAVGFKSDEFATFKGSKTYCLKTGNQKYDEAIASAMSESWKITPFEFVSEVDLKVKIKDKSASFLCPILIGEPNHGYHYLALFNGGRKSVSNYAYDDLVAYSPINKFVDEAELTDCSWRIRNMIESMVLGLEIVQKNNIDGNSLKMVNQLRDYYNKKSPQIKSRTLLISETSMGYKFKKSDIPAVYPFKVEVCPRSKIEKAINDKSKDYYYLQPGITLNKSIFVIDPSNGEVLYFNYDTMGLNVTKKNVEEMVETIKK